MWGDSGERPPITAQRGLRTCGQDCQWNGGTRRPTVEEALSSRRSIALDEEFVQRRCRRTASNTRRPQCRLVFLGSILVLLDDGLVTWGYGLVSRGADWCPGGLGRWFWTSLKKAETDTFVAVVYPPEQKS